MQFKKGLGWRACYDEGKGLCTAKSSWRGDYYLYEITKEVFDRLDNPGDGEYADDLICKGRLLYESHDNEYCSPYNIVHDENYAKMCSWTEIQQTDHTWSKELTDAAKRVIEGREE